MLAQDCAVDGCEGLLAWKGHGKHAEVPLPGTTTHLRQAVGDQLVAGLASWGADSVLIA